MNSVSFKKNLLGVKEKTIKIGGKNRHLSVFTPCFDSFQVLFSVVPPLKLVNRYYI